MKQLVLESTLKQFTGQQALEYISLKLGHEIGIDYYNKIKRGVKDSIGRTINILQKDRYAYIGLYFERIEQLRYAERKLHEIIDKHDHNPILQKGCIAELAGITQSLTSLYEMLPELIVLQSSYNEAYTHPELEKEDKREPDDPEAAF